MREDDAIKRAARDGFIFGTGYFYMDEEGAHYVDPRDVLSSRKMTKKRESNTLKTKKRAIS